MSIFWPQDLSEGSSLIWMKLFIPRGMKIYFKLTETKITTKKQVLLYKNYSSHKTNKHKPHYNETKLKQGLPDICGIYIYDMMKHVINDYWAEIA